jgi:hypothetical protein
MMLQRDRFSDRKAKGEYENGFYTFNIFHNSGVQYSTRVALSADPRIIARVYIKRWKSQESR